MFVVRDLAHWGFCGEGGASLLFVRCWGRRQGGDLLGGFRPPPTSKKQNVVFLCVPHRKKIEEDLLLEAYIRKACLVVLKCTTQESIIWAISILSLLAHL